MKRLMRKLLHAMGRLKSGIKRMKVRTEATSKQFCKAHKLVDQPIQDADVPPYNYFTKARSWADDFYTSVEASRNRWKALALWVLTPVSVVLLVSVTMLIPVQHLVPLMVNHYNNGLVTVTPLHSKYTPHNQAEVENNLAQYVRFRESYSANTYQYSYRLISLMSSPAIRRAYDRAQSSVNKHAPINLLGNKRYRTVKIQSMVFLDNAKKNDAHKHITTHRNLAQVDFVVTDHDIKSGAATSMPLTVLVSWSYHGVSKNPSNRWLNWNGFVVSTYQVQQRNV